MIVQWEVRKGFAGSWYAIKYRIVWYICYVMLKRLEY